MDIKQFEKRVTELLTYIDDDGISHVEDCMEISVHDDGCLCCRVDGKEINTEGFPWDIALDIIVEHLEKRKGG